jgi:hypothetical protein
MERLPSLLPLAGGSVARQSRCAHRALRGHRHLGRLAHRARAREFDPSIFLRRPNIDLRQAICSSNSAKESGAPIFLWIKQAEAALRQNQTLFENSMDSTSSAQRS